MKKEKIARALGLVDDDLIAEAAPAAREKSKKRSAVRIAIAACLLLSVIALNLWLFIPYSADPTAAIAKYRGSEYYEVMRRLELMNAETAKKSNFVRFWGKATREDKAPNADGDIAFDVMDGSVDLTGGYEEVTDNQVKGVIEADLFKRTDTHLFYLREGEVSVYSIAGEASILVSTYNIGARGGTEMFLSEDGKTLTVITQSYHWQAPSLVELISLNVSDPAHIVEDQRFSISGSYCTARSVNGQILLITSFSVPHTVRYADVADFVPHYNAGEGEKPVAAEDIIYPEELTGRAYTVICKLNEKTLDLLGQKALLSYTGSVFATNEDVFVTRAYGEHRELKGTVYSHSMTEIVRVCYAGEGLEYKGAVSVDGSVKNQYSMDVHNGILRVVTTTRVLPEYTSMNGSIAVYDVDTSFATNADLYCIDLATGQVVASVKQFAPAGDTVESVRFDGNYAYVCTAVVEELDDPIYFFDLSDLQNITYKDTGVIAGYSSSLVNFGNGYLLGIGFGDQSNTLKIEVYAEGENAVTSVCRYEQDRVNFANSYKAYFIDRENGLVGLDLFDYTANAGYYVLLCFNGSELVEVLREPVSASLRFTRATLIDGYFYILTVEDFKVVPLSE